MLKSTYFHNGEHNIFLKNKSMKNSSFIIESSLVLLSGKRNIYPTVDHVCGISADTPNNISNPLTSRRVPYFDNEP